MFFYSNAPRIPPSRAGRRERGSEELKSSLTKIGKHGHIDLQKYAKLLQKCFKIVSNLSQNRAKMVLWEVQAASIEAMAPPNGRRGGSGRPMDVQRGAQGRPRRSSEAQLGSPGSPNGGPRGSNGEPRVPNGRPRRPKGSPKGATRR